MRGPSPLRRRAALRWGGAFGSQVRARVNGLARGPRVLMRVACVPPIRAPRPAWPGHPARPVNLRTLHRDRSPTVPACPAAAQRHACRIPATAQHPACHIPGNPPTALSRFAVIHPPRPRVPAATQPPYRQKCAFWVVWGDDRAASEPAPTASRRCRSTTCLVSEVPGARRLAFPACMRPIRVPKGATCCPQRPRTRVFG